MEELAGRATTEGGGRRQRALTDFGEVVATLPFDLKAAKNALLHVKDVGGQELAVEACAAVMALEATTRISDGTLRKPLPPAAITFVRLLNTVAFFFIKTFWLFLGGH